MPPYIVLERDSNRPELKVGRAAIFILIDFFEKS